MSQFWQMFDSLGGLSTSLPDWKVLLRDEFEHITPMLRATDKLAGGIPMPGNPYERYIVDHWDDEEVHLVHEFVDDYLTLPRRELLQHEFDIRKFAALMAELIGFESRVEKLESPLHRFKLGDFGHTSGFTFPIYLSISRSATQRWCVESLVINNYRPFLLFTPSSYGMDSRCYELIEHREGVHLALSESLHLDATGDWQLTEMAKGKLIGFCERHIPNTQAAKPTMVFPTPLGARWSDLSIHFKDGDSAAATIQGVSQILHYSQFGMINMRNAKPTKQWELLRVYAKNRGVLTWRDSGASRQVKKQTQELCGKLSEVFRIDGLPIEYDPAIKGYRTVFRTVDDA